MGMVKTQRIGQSAAKLLRAFLIIFKTIKKFEMPMEKVQRLSGSGLACFTSWLKIESGPAERQP